MDCEVWLEYHHEGYPQGKILFSHYSKPSASKLVIQRESAMSLSMIRTILTQEGLRVLLNCHPDLPNEEVGRKMIEFTQKCKNSGCPISYPSKGQNHEGC